MLIYNKAKTKNTLKKTFLRDCSCFIVSPLRAWISCLFFFCFFYQALHQATRWGNLVQLFNAESHAIGIRPVHGIDDAIAKYIFDKFVERNGYVYVPDNIDTEWLIQFPCDNIVLLKSNSG